MLKRMLIILGAILLVFVLLVGAYILYMQLNYYRIEDNLPLEISRNTAHRLATEEEYTAVTYNVGFGAYDQAYSFFMDTGKMADGTPVAGKYSRARSKENAMKNTLGSVEAVVGLSPDFLLLQEVDVKATRSYQINQKEIVEQAFPDYASAFALNFHAPYMIYPFLEPHGSVEAGLLSLSKYSLTSATRISYPVDQSFFTKFFDLDRCFTLLRYPVSNGKELVMINTHMSAYDEGGIVRAEQLKLLNSTMKSEVEKGNYVIVGGDFNHALAGTIDAFPTEQMLPEWVFELNNQDLTEGMSIAAAVNDKQVPTCRSCDIPYTKGVNYTSVLDGFLISDNVVAVVQNIDIDFLYSDHNPVKLTFRLKGED